MDTLEDRFSYTFIKLVYEISKANKDVVHVILKEYTNLYEKIRGPSPEECETREQAIGVANICEYLPTDGDFEAFVTKVQARMKRDAEVGNPYLPIWGGKTEDSPNQWTYDCGTMSQEGRDNLDALLRAISPVKVSK